MTLEHLLVIAKEEDRTRTVMKTVSRYNLVIKKIIVSDMDDNMKDYCLSMHFNKTVNGLNDTVLSDKIVTHMINYFNGMYRKNKCSDKEYT